MLISGSPIDWSTGYASAVVARGYITAADAALNTTSWVCTVTSYAPDEVDQLCGLRFGMPSLLSVLPTVTCNSGAGIEPSPINFLLAGGLLSDATATLTLTYASATAVTTITPVVLPDPISGTYPTSLTYEVFVDGVSKGAQSITPSSSTAISISIAATCSTIKIVLTAVGTCLVSDVLPSATKQTATLPAIVDVWVMDATYGNLTKAKYVVTASASLLQPAMLKASWG